MQPLEPFLLETGNRNFLVGEPLRSRSVFKARAGLLFVTAVFLLCSSLAVWAALEWGRCLLLQCDGVAVQAQVIKRRKNSDREGGPTYHVTYQYQVVTRAGPQSYSREQEIAESTYQSLKEVKRVPVRYSALFPSISSLADEHHRRNWVTFAALFWSPPTVYLGWLVLHCRRQLRLAREGQVLEGRVTSCTGVEDSEENFKVELSYRCTAPTGRMVLGKGSAYRADLKGGPLPDRDTPVAILYLDEDNHKVL